MHKHTENCNHEATVVVADAHTNESVSVNVTVDSAVTNMPTADERRRARNKRKAAKQIDRVRHGQVSKKVRKVRRAAARIEK